MPHLVSAFMVQAYLFGSVRWSFVSELYELMQSIYTFPAIVKVFLNPRAPSFNVTAKGRILNRDFISPLAKPFLRAARAEPAGDLRRRISPGILAGSPPVRDRHYDVLGVLQRLRAPRLSRRPARAATNAFHGPHGHEDPRPHRHRRAAHSRGHHGSLEWRRRARHRCRLRGATASRSHRAARADKISASIRASSTSRSATCATGTARS